MGAAVVFVVSAVVFFVPRLAGDPVQSMLPLDHTPEQRDALEKSLGWDRPLLTQFWDFLSGAARLDFGDSVWQRRPALEVISDRLPATLELAGAAILITLIVALPLGVAAALRPNSAADRLVTALALVGFSIPLFFLGLILMLTFSVWLGWLPTSGRGSLAHLVLPSVALALNGIGSLTVLTRSVMIEELNRPWIRTARAKNLPFRRTVGVHALKNAAPTIVTGIGLDIISLVATGVVIAEVVFAWPGLGTVALVAITRNDLVLLQALVFCAATAVVLLNIVIDLLYKLFDPRIDYTQDSVRSA